MADTPRLARTTLTSGGLMAHRSLLLAVFALWVAAVGCSSMAAADNPQGAPSWLGHFGIFDGPDGRWIEAVGTSGVTADPGGRRSAALSNGRSRLALTVEALSRQLAAEVVLSLRDDFADEVVESGRFIDRVSRRVTDEVMRVPESEGPGPPERWTDPLTRTSYVLMRLELQDLAEAYRGQMERAHRRESMVGAVSTDTVVYADTLESQLRDLRALSVEQLARRFPSRPAW